MIDCAAALGGSLAPIYPAMSGSNGGRSRSGAETLDADSDGRTNERALDPRTSVCSSDPDGACDVSHEMVVTGDGHVKATPTQSTVIAVKSVLLEINQRTRQMATLSRHLELILDMPTMERGAKWQIDTTVELAYREIHKSANRLCDTQRHPTQILVLNPSYEYHDGQEQIPDLLSHFTRAPELT